MFIFCCYTGLAYNEMNELKQKHIIKGFDGNLWIKMIRKKTQKNISIPLLSKVVNMIHIEINSEAPEQKVLPKIQLLFKGDSIYSRYREITNTSYS